MLVVDEVMNGFIITDTGEMLLNGGDGVFGQRVVVDEIAGRGLV